MRPPLIGLEQAGEGGGPFGGERGVRRDAVIGHAVPGGKAQHLDLGGEEGERLGKLSEPRVVAGDMQQRAPVLGAAAGDEQGVITLRRTVDGDPRHDA